MRIETKQMVHDIGDLVPCSQPKPCLVCVENDDPPFAASLNTVKLINHVRRRHPHLRKRPGHVACGCGEGWSFHSLHVEQRVNDALLERLAAVEAVLDEWRNDSPRFGFRRATEYADDLMDVLCDWEVGE